MYPSPDKTEMKTSFEANQVLSSESYKRPIHEELEGRRRKVFLKYCLMASLSMYSLSFCLIHGLPVTLLVARVDRDNLCLSIPGCRIAQSVVKVDISTGRAIWDITMTTAAGIDQAALRNQINAYLDRSRMRWVSTKSIVTLNIQSGKRGGKA